FELITRKKDFCDEILRDRDRPLTGILEISKGCTGLCAYCIVRIAKGPLVSKSTYQILQEAKIALAEGCKELWLTAQDTASYGVDTNTSLPHLLESLVDLPEDFLVRIGMMNVDYAYRILEPLKYFLQHPKVYSFLHIPVQSGSDSVLKKMNRKYTIKEFKDLVENLRKEINLTLSTDIIVGFPGETDEDFERTLQVLDEIQFDVVNISKYGDRKGTEASKSKEKLPTEIIKQRSVALTKKVHKMSLARNKNWIGWDGTALALRRDERSSATLLRNKSYKLIAVDNPTLELGKWYNIVMTRNSTSNELRWYHDGVDKDIDSYSMNVTASDNPVTIGVRDLDRGRAFNGTIDELRIYNRPLSAEEIQQLYFSNLNKYDTDKWVLYVNQSKNSTDGLDDGTYTYQAFAKD
ncbi:MAG: MiaB/RimO family radical SAM methylthiotransferase, partial [Candidatus Heimdallarchaeota archaeon]|nr:MiaB/RimO family radical SAM methylthiotransferase [Candidatus Heimdallarchaeota archaeon]